MAAMVAARHESPTENDLVGTEFDADFYRAEYPDIDLPRTALLEHFCTIGWHEGRNPNAEFDTVAYLEINTDVAKTGGNPFIHYLRHGREEGRTKAPSATPSLCTLRLFGRPITDWVERLRPHVDLSFYAEILGENLPDGADPVAHFAYRGWRRKLSPNPLFDMPRWLAGHGDLAETMVNPVLIELEGYAAAGCGQMRSSKPLLADNRQPTATPQAGIDEGQLALVRRHFSTSFYRRHYPDVDARNIDPVLHYMTSGWRDGRNPTPDFHTRYYLAANPDVAAAGVNPFWHYLITGEKEGRVARRPGDAARKVIEALRPHGVRSHGHKPLSDKRLGADGIAAFAPRLATSRGLVLSFSHDCYAISIGGVQIVITDEQERCVAGGWSYLHVSPARPQLTLAAGGSGFLVRVVLDGMVLGICELEMLADQLAAILPASLPRVAVLHSVLGFHLPQIAGVLALLAPQHAYFWLHDYTALCPGLHLLRNDVEFCGSPPLESLACRICIHGERRMGHVRAMEELFQAHAFDVLAPSRTALEIWRRSVSWPHRSAQERPHWILRETAAAPSRRPGGPVRVAFVGSPTPTKGWPAFCALAEKLLVDPRYHAMHLASGGAQTLPGVEFVRTEVSAGDRYATIRLLRELRIDYVLVLSPTPETFCFVAHEALIAGARILCLTDAGHVPVLIAQTGRGRIFGDAAELADFFAAGLAETLAAELDTDPVGYEIADVGTTAGLILGSSPEGVDTDAEAHA